MTDRDDLSHEVRDALPVPASIQEALDLFQLNVPFSIQDLHQRYRELSLVWHPHRYAGLTNSPKQYMQMYKKGEAMSKALQEAYAQLQQWVQQERTEKQ